MKLLAQTAALAATSLLFFGVAQASTLQLDFTYDFSDPFDPNSAPPDGAGPWATAIFDDAGSTGSVTLTINNLANEITGLWFNLDDSMDAGSLSIIADGSNPVTANNIYQAGTAAQMRADGSGLYDIAFDLPPPGSTFTSGQTLIYNITGAGLTASSFGFSSELEVGSTAGPYLAAAKFQSTGDGEQSAWVAAVPVPAAVWLFGSGLGLLGWMRRKSIAAK